MLKVYFFLLPELTKCCSGGGGGRSGEVAPAYQVIKKAQKRSSVALHAVSNSMLQRLQNVIKKQRGKAGF